MNMSEFSLDYDYPVNEKRPVLKVKPDLFWYKKNNGMSSQSSSSSSSLSMNSLNKISSEHLPSDNLWQNRNESIGSFGFYNDLTVSESDSNHTETKIAGQLSILDIPLPPKKNIVDTSTISIYYDTPKNIPVNPRFGVNEKYPSMTHLPLAPTRLPIKDHVHKKPEIPRKSSFVRSKISTYQNTLPNYQNIKPYLEQLRNDNDKMDNSSNPISSINKKITSKSLPRLPYEKEKVIANKANILIPKAQTNLKMIQNNHNIDDENDDYEEEDCDYDYDYVCLESKKKLDDDDQKIKRLLSKEEQSRYQHLVFSSVSNNDLEPFSSNFQSSKISSSRLNTKLVMNRYYRPIIMEAKENFQNWTEFTTEVIKQEHKPEVYFNFVKHILLSGQNLLSIFKMIQQRNSANINRSNQQDLQQFSETFFDILKQIVTKTKKASSSINMNCGPSFDELIECLQYASQMANRCTIIID